MNLITGATGLVGAHVALKLLMQGKPVIALRRKNSDAGETEKLFSYYTPDYKTLFSKISWRGGDVTDVLSLDEAMQGVDTVYHCAGFVSLNDKDEKELFRINRDGTANAVNAALGAGVKRFCHVSSVATIQNADIHAPLDETIFWKAGKYQSAYAISKYLGEQEVWRGIEEGLNAVIVNPGVIIGPGFWSKGTGQLFSLSLKGIKFYTEGRTGFVSANDVAEIMIALTEQEKFGERFILVEDNYSFRDVLNKIHAGLGRPQPSVRAGRFLLNAGRFFGGLGLADANITKATVNSVLGRTTYSSQKVKQNLNYHFESLNDCISFTCRSLLKQISSFR